MSWILWHMTKKIYLCYLGFCSVFIFLLPFSCCRFTKPQTFADCIGNELPLGWEEAYDKHVGAYYINHVNRKFFFRFSLSRKTVGYFSLLYFFRHFLKSWACLNFDHSLYYFKNRLKWLYFFSGNERGKGENFSAFFTSDWIKIFRWYSILSEECHKF